MNNVAPKNTKVPDFRPLRGLTRLSDGGEGAWSNRVGSPFAKVLFSTLSYLNG